MNLRLFAHVLSLETRKQLSYRLDFWINTLVTFAAHMAVAYYLWRAVYTETPQETIAGYTFNGMLVYYVVVILLGKLVRGNERANTVAQDIYQGQLTRYLLFPSSYGGFKYAEHLGTLLPATLQLVLLGAAAFLFLDLPPDCQVSATSLLQGLAAVAAANLLYFRIHFLVQLVAFWADNVWALSVMARFITSLLGGFLLPLSLFPAGVQSAVEYLPFPYVFSFPVNSVLGRIPPDQWAQGLGICLAWCLLLGAVHQALWRRGCRQYTGVGI